MEYKFLIQELQEKIIKIQNKYLTKEQAIIPSLHLIQETYKDIPQEAVKELSHFLQIPLADIEGIVSFYDMFRYRKNAKNHIRLCRNLPCHLGKSRKLLKMLEKLTGTQAGESSPDGKWYIELVECI
jgi:NADH:ubiquinone oxidoreductase subunit E